MKRATYHDTSRIFRRVAIVAMASLTCVSALPAFAAISLSGQVQGGGAPLVGSTVTLWAASAGVPRQLAQSKTDASGSFALSSADAEKGPALYLVAKGGRSAADKSGTDNPAISLMAAVGSNAPATVTINEMTTVASVWTHNQFIDGTAIKGEPLQLKIAAA